MEYTVIIDDHAPPLEPREFDNVEAACDYAVSYVNDEYAENPEPGVAPNGKPFTLHELYAAVGTLCSGFARGGDFSAVFQGEAIKVSCVYENLAEMFSVLTLSEKFAANQDGVEACPYDEVDSYMADRMAAVAKFGDPAAAWQMVVYEWIREASEDLLGELHRADALYVDKGGYVSWESANGVVTMWQVK